MPRLLRSLLPVTGGRDAFFASLAQARPRWSWLVAAVWVAMLVLATTYVTRNGRNLPMQDEWEFIPPLLGLTSGWDWAFEKHYEHVTSSVGFSTSASTG